MSNLTRFDHDGIELIIDISTGESFASVSGYARMSGKAQQTISKRLKGTTKSRITEAQIETEGGLQGVNLVDEDFICDWLPKDNPEMAKQLMKLGVRVFLHKLAGYKVETSAVNESAIAKIDHSAELVKINERLETMEIQRQEENRIVIQMLSNLQSSLTTIVEASADAIAEKVEQRMEAKQQQLFAKSDDRWRKIKERQEMEDAVRNPHRYRI